MEIKSAVEKSELREEADKLLSDILRKNPRLSKLLEKLIEKEVEEKLKELIKESEVSAISRK